MTRETSGEREKRLADALRQNLARRKQQARAKNAPDANQSGNDPKNAKQQNR